MASKYIESYYKYFLWNEGLLNYFFRNNRNGEIILNIDGDILKTIARQNTNLQNILLRYPNSSIIGDDQSIDNLPEDSNWYKERFLATDELFCRYYNEYIIPCRKREYTNRPCNRRQNRDWQCKHFPCINDESRNDVLAVANHINERIIYYKRDEDKRLIMDNDGNAITFDLPFFAIVIYIILKFDNGGTQGWNNLPNIRPLSHQYINILWTKINDYDRRFNHEATIYTRNQGQNQDYVGKIKYHLPLSRAEIRVLRDAIYWTNVWKFYDELLFEDQIKLLFSHFAENNNQDLTGFIQVATNNILKNRIDEEIRNFDVDRYEERLRGRALQDRRPGRIIGESALGIHFPNNGENKIVLLTTISHAVDDDNYSISDSNDCYYGIYNANFVKYQNSDSVRITECSPINGRNRVIVMNQMEIGDVVFFYRYSNDLYIQTREILPSPAYIVAVRNANENIQRFRNWCEENDNLDYIELDRRELFGNDWRIYYFRTHLRGQYYGVNNELRTEVPTIRKKGGIKNIENKYFVNALPYIEVPTTINPEELNVYLGINNYLIEENTGYSKINIEGKIIIDINQNINIGDAATCSLTIEHGGENLLHEDFPICGQFVDYNQGELHKYDLYGRFVNEDRRHRDVVLSGNVMLRRVRDGIDYVNNIDYLTPLEEIGNDMYFVNLLAACCFESENIEIPHRKFEKCLRYAATRLGIDSLQNNFVKNARSLLESSGIISVNYTDGKRCQAIPPVFSKVPIIKDGNNMIMLSGCYSRKFINDLFDYCIERDITVYKWNREFNSPLGMLLPQKIFLPDTFDVQGFITEKQHLCDDLTDVYLGASILRSVQDFRNLTLNLFNFERNLNLDQDLERPNENNFPRIRKSNTMPRRWYIESNLDEFANIDAFYPWATIYCNICRNIAIAYCCGEKLFIPKGILLPTPIARALYETTFEMPSIEKVFICDYPESEKYYSEMKVYNFLTTNFCTNISDMLNARNGVNSRFLMEFWTENDELAFNENINRVNLVLKNENNNIIAVAFQREVFIRRDNGNRYCKVEGRLNEVFTALIRYYRFGFQMRGNTIRIGRVNQNLEFDIDPNDMILFPIGGEELYTIDNILII